MGQQLASGGHMPDPSWRSQIVKSSTLRLEMCLLSGMIVKIKSKSVTKSWRMTQLKIMNNLKHPGLLISTCRFPIGLWSDCYLVEISFIVGTHVLILYRTKRHWTIRSPNAWFLSLGGRAREFQVLYPILFSAYTRRPLFSPVPCLIYQHLAIEFIRIKKISE